jgi:hypothetical protein
MLKTILYICGTTAGLLLALASPLAGVIVNIEAYLMNPSVITEDTTSFRYQFFAAIALMAGLVFCRPRTLPRAGSEGLVLKALWLFVAVAFIGCPFAVVDSGVAWEWAYDFFKTVLVSSLFVFAIRSERDMYLVTWACLIGTAHAAFVHVLGARLDWVPRKYCLSSYEGGLGGVLPDSQGAVLSMFVPTFILFAVYSKGWVRKLFCIGSLLLVLDSIVNTYQRCYFVSLAVDVVLLALFLPQRIVWRLTPIILIAVCAFLLFMTPQDYWERMSTILEPSQEESAASRFKINEGSWKMFQEFPLGVGYRNYPVVSPRYLPLPLLSEGERSAHNSYYTVLCETGVFGFLIWIASPIGAVLLLRRIRRTSDMKDPSPTTISAMGFEIGLYGWFVGGFTNSLNEVDPVYWFVAFAVILTRLHAARRREAEGGELRRPARRTLRVNLPVAGASS